MNREIVFKLGVYECSFISRIKRAMNFTTDEQAIVFALQYCGERLQHIKRANAHKTFLAKQEQKSNSKRAKKENVENFDIPLSPSAEKKQGENKTWDLLADFV